MKRVSGLSNETFAGRSFFISDSRAESASGESGGGGGAGGRLERGSVTESFMTECLIIESDIESIILIPVSIAAGAGAMAAPVSTGLSSFLVQAGRSHRVAAIRGHESR